MFSLQPLLIIMIIIIPLLAVLGGMIGIAKVVSDFFLDRGWSMGLGFVVFVFLSAVYIGVLAGFALPFLQRM